MYTEELTRAENAATKTPPVGAALFTAVALALEARGNQKTAGYEGIERRERCETLDAPVENNVFGWIAEEMRELGIQGDMSSVGSTLSTLGIKGGENGLLGYKGNVLSNEDALWRAAHEIGCHCLGDEITADEAAERVRALTPES